MNLKKLMMDLGNALVLEHGYEPAHSHAVKSTRHIAEFTCFVNESKEAQKWLKSQGIEWPTVNSKNT